MAWLYLLLPGALIWFGILMLPWRLWSTDESLDADPGIDPDLSDITALIPARNEASTIQTTLPALARQGSNLQIILIDDQSNDETASAARSLHLHRLQIVAGKPIPHGWNGKLWALEQGRGHVNTRFTLLMDADIELKPGILARLQDKLESEHLHAVSLMAELRMEGFWGKLLMPAYIYFFKLLYPFRLSNSRSSSVAAAAGGCILVRSEILAKIGGFHAIKGQLIDDCALAHRIKAEGGKTWIGLTHSVQSIRPYERLSTIWDTVARTAYTQLHHSTLLLAVCTLTLLASFALPALGLFFPSGGARALSVATVTAMAVSYLPTLNYYGVPAAWALWMPVIGILYLAMTWTSAIRHWSGAGAKWKGRTYAEMADER
ncbi:MAG: glycosyltransferase [Gammaproteobacteria bacterium]|nr:glycosyltransferase [Gammaproteobacteria bacterium]